jgi:hypothetical protein
LAKAELTMPYEEAGDMEPNPATNHSCVRRLS